MAKTPQPRLAASPRPSSQTSPASPAHLSKWRRKRRRRLLKRLRSSWSITIGVVAMLGTVLVYLQWSGDHPDVMIVGGIWRSGPVWQVDKAGSRLAHPAGAAEVLAVYNVGQRPITVDEIEENGGGSPVTSWAWLNADGTTLIDSPEVVPPKEYRLVLAQTLDITLELIQMRDSDGHLMTLRRGKDAPPQFGTWAKNFAAACNSSPDSCPDRIS